MRRLVPLVVLLVVVAATMAAKAHTRTILDNDDSPGPLDLVAAQVRHPDAQLKLHVRTYEPWSDRTLEGEKSFVRFDFNLDADPRIERCIVVKLDPPEEEGPTAVVGGIYKNDCSERISEHPGNVFRHQTNSLTLVPQQRSFAKRSFRWRASSSFEEEGHEDCAPPTIGPEPVYGACADFTRWSRHRVET